LCYFILIVGYGWIYKRKRKKRVVKIIFFSWGSLTWWAIGASLIASNISAEQFIGMSGSGFKMGLAIATYESGWPLYLNYRCCFLYSSVFENKIFTMPQYLNQRYIVM
jgi:SSS family solute:Na+ symporter